MKLLIFIHSMSSGGAERVTANLSNYWASQGREITVVTLASKDLDFYQLNPKINRIPLNLASDTKNWIEGLFRNLIRVLALRRVLKEVRPDVAIGMITTGNIYLALASRGLKIKTIGCEHNYPPQHPISAFWGKLRQFAYGLLDIVTALTEEGRVWVEQHTRAKRVVTMPNPVTWPLQPVEPKKTPDPVYKGQRKMLLAAGRLQTQKGFDYLIDAFAQLAGEYQDWDLFILGEGDLRPSLQSQINNLKLGERIFLAGNAGNINEWYETASLYVMSSRYEGFPMTLVEAMAHGLAAVSFDCNTGPRDIIRHGLDGLLVPHEDVGALAKSLGQLMSQDALRAQFAQRALETRDRFSMKKISMLWEKLFQELS